MQFVKQRLSLLQETKYKLYLETVCFTVNIYNGKTKLRSPQNLKVTFHKSMDKYEAMSSLRENVRVWRGKGGDDDDTFLRVMTLFLDPMQQPLIMT